MYLHLAKDDYCEAVHTAQHDMRDRRQQGGTLTDEDWSKLLNRIASEINKRVQEGRGMMVMRVTLSRGEGGRRSE